MSARISRKGTEVKRLGEFLEDRTLPAYQASSHPDEQLREFISDGVVFEYQLADVVHGEDDARSIDRGQLNYWIKSALNLERATVTTLEPAAAAAARAESHVRAEAPSGEVDVPPGRRMLAR